MARESREPSLVGRETQRKSCTDWYCCLLFVVCLAATGVLAGYGFHNGDTKNLELVLRGQDLEGQTCGRSSGVKDFPLTYFTLEKGQTAPTDWNDNSRKKLKPVCTNKCPSYEDTRTSETREAGRCASNMYPDNCTWYGGNTTQLMNYCLDPDVFGVSLNGASDWGTDIHAAMWHLLFIFPVAIIIGLLYLTTMEKCGGLFIWSLIALVILVPAGVGFFLFHDATSDTHLQNVVHIKPQDEKTIAIVFWAISAIFALIACCSLKSINGVAKVVKFTSEFLKDVPSQFVQPLLFAIVHLIVIAAWFTILFLVLSVWVHKGDAKEMQSCLADQDFLCVKWDTGAAAGATVFLLLMIFWMLNFLHACSHFGTAFAVHEWYFTSPDPITGNRKPGSGGHTLCDCKLSAKGVSTGLRRHSGSFAFGSLCISICKVIKFLLCWLKKDAETRSGNPVLKCVLRCAVCLAECMERFIVFVSEHAYVEMAIQGQGFCKSAQEAMVLTVRNPVLFAVVGRVACLVKVLGVALITMVGAYVVHLTLQWFPPKPAPQSSVPPIVAAALFSLFFGELMMHPFTAASRAALHCFVLDKSSSYDGSRAAQYCPQALNTFVEEHDVDRGETRGCCC